MLFPIFLRVPPLGSQLAELRAVGVLLYRVFGARYAFETAEP
jgi:hypothetical protein